MRRSREHQVTVEKVESKSYTLASDQRKQYYHQAEVSGSTTELDSEILKKHLFNSLPSQGES